MSVCGGLISFRRDFLFLSHLGSMCPAAGGREVVGGFLASAGPMLHFVPQVQSFCVCLAPQWRGGEGGGSGSQHLQL